MANSETRRLGDARDRRWALAILLAAILSSAFARAGSPEAAGTGSFVIRAKYVYPVTVDQPGPIENGMIIVREGRIVAVGRELDLPPDLPLIELRDASICPGFVSAGSSLAGRHSGAHSVSGVYRALDTFDTYDDFAELLSKGTTTVHLDPGGHRLVAGRGAVVKLAGEPDARVLMSAAGLTINLGVFGPPPVVDVPFYASSDVAIEPARRQRPGSRLGQFLELEERIGRATEGVGDDEGKFDWHARTFGQAWRARLPLRIQVRRAADIEGAIAFLKRHESVSGYLVGMTEAEKLTAALAGSGFPVLLRLEQRYRGADANLGPRPDALQPRESSAGELEAEKELKIALAGREGDTNEDLRMVGALAMRGGMSREQALAGVTRIAAEILGVDQRVGSLAPGKDADLLVLSGEPLGISAHVLRVYVGGRVAFNADRSEAGRPERADRSETGPPLVVKAGTIWVGDGRVIRDGGLLIEDGRIQAVGQRVPHPPFARVVDAGADGFVVPGFIDAQGHLGLQGDRTKVTPDVPIHRVVGVAGREFRRVAQAGVTTMILSPYSVASDGGRMAAIKTFGRHRGDMLIRDVTGLKFSVGTDPVLGIEPLKKAIAAGKKYDEKWKKYYEALKKWEEDRAKGVVKKEQPKEEVVEEKREADPITGTWEWTVGGDPLPQEFNGTAMLKLSDTSIEGRGSAVGFDEEFDVEGELSGDQVRMEIVLDTPMGRPTIEATLDREDHMIGKIKLGDEAGFDLEATRTSKESVEFKVTRRRKHLKDGRPEPPKVNEKLEPYRALLAGKIPAVVRVRTAAQVQAVLKLLVDEHHLSVILLGAEDAADVAVELGKRSGGAASASRGDDGKTGETPKGEILGVVVPATVIRQRDRVPYNQAADLSRRGLRVAFQSDAEDGARALPLMGLYAVQQGLGGDAALRALTIDAARMYKIDDRVGSLEPGKDGDVVIFRGHPFDADSRLERVIVGGRDVPEQEER